jgi:Ner family transcriptional regulator
MKTDMLPPEIKEMIRARGVTLSQLSEMSGFSKAAVSVALKVRSPYVQQAVADFLGMPPQQIWPSRYDANGSPVRLDPRGRHRITPAKLAPRQQRGAVQ